MTNEERDTKLDKIYECVIAQEERCKGFDKRIGNLEATTYGNGKAGLKTQVAIMWWTLTTLLSSGGLTAVVFLIRNVGK